MKDAGCESWMLALGGLWSRAWVLQKRSKTVRHQGFHCRPRPEYTFGATVLNFRMPIRAGVFTVLWSNHAPFINPALHVTSHHRTVHISSHATVIIVTLSDLSTLVCPKRYNSALPFEFVYCTHHQTPSNHEGDLFSSDIRPHPICSTQSGDTPVSTRCPRVCARWVFPFVKYQPALTVQQSPPFGGANASDHWAPPCGYTHRWGRRNGPRTSPWGPVGFLVPYY